MPDKLVAKKDFNKNFKIISFLKIIIIIFFNFIACIFDQIFTSFTKR